MKKAVVGLVVTLLILLPYPVLAQNLSLSPSIKENMRVFYILEEPSRGTVKVVYEFKNTADEEISMELSGSQTLPWVGSQIIRAYDVPLGSLNYEASGDHSLSFSFSKNLLPSETYKVVFEMSIPTATYQTEEGWLFKETLANPFQWPLHEVEVRLTLPKGWFTLYDPIWVDPGARITEEEFKKTVIWLEEGVEPGESIVTVCEFAPKPHMYAIGQAVSIIIVIVAFIYIFIIKKGFPAPMGFVRTVPGEDKPEKSNVIGAIEDLIRDAKKEVLITSPWIYYVDWFTSNIKQLTDRGVEVRIITWPSYERKKTGRDWVLVENKKQGFALSRFLAMFPKDTVRLNPSVHAKMIVVDRLKVMTSSSNLTQTGLWENYEAGIWIEDEDMAQKAADYFNKIWMAEDTIPLTQEMFNPHKLKEALGWDW